MSRNRSSEIWPYSFVRKTLKIWQISKKCSDCKNTYRFGFYGPNLPIPLEKLKIGEMSGSDFFERHFWKLLCFQKPLKIRKNRNNYLRAKIFADSVSVGPIYIFHLKNRKIFFYQNRKSCKAFVVFSILVKK